MFPQLFAAETVASPSKIMTIGVRQQRPPISAKRLESPNTLFPSRPLSIPPSSITNKDKATKRAEGGRQKAEGRWQRAEGRRQKAEGERQNEESKKHKCAERRNAGGVWLSGFELLGLGHHAAKHLPHLLITA